MNAENIDLTGLKYEPTIFHYYRSTYYDGLLCATWESTPDSVKEKMLNFVETHVRNNLLRLPNISVIYIPSFMAFLRENKSWFKCDPDVVVLVCHAINAYLKDNKDFPYPYSLSYDVDRYGRGCWKIHIIYNMKNEAS